MVDFSDNVLKNGTSSLVFDTAVSTSFRSLCPDCPSTTEWTEEHVVPCWRLWPGVICLPVVLWAEYLKGWNFPVSTEHSREKLTAFWLSHSVSEFEKPPSEFGHTILFSLHVAPKRKALFQSSFWWQCILESRPSLGRGDGGSEMQGRVCLSWWWGCKRDLTSYETDFRKHSHLL